MLTDTNVKKITALILVFLLILISNMAVSGKIYPNNNGDDDPDIDFYYSYEEIANMLDNFSKKYTDIFFYSSLGKTYENRDIFYVKISDNVTTDEDEPEILLMGGVHGCEGPGYQVVMYTIKSYLENYTTVNENITFTNRIRNIINNTEIFFIPMVNPDGCVAGTRKNVEPNLCIFGKTFFRGVDINRNFGYKWYEFYRHPFKYAFNSPYLLFRFNVVLPFMDNPQIGNGCYRGPYPFSEKESKAVKLFVETHNIKISVDYHTAGEIIIYPWFWKKEKTKDEPIFRSIAENISGINGYEIQNKGDGYELLGTSADWMYAEHNILAMGLELCNVSGPETPTDEQLVLNVCKQHVGVNIYLSERAIAEFA